MADRRIIDLAPDVLFGVGRSAFMRGINDAKQRKAPRSGQWVMETLAQIYGFTTWSDDEHKRFRAIYGAGFELVKGWQRDTKILGAAEDAPKGQLERAQREAVEALESARQAWLNALEIGLIPESHRGSAERHVEELSAALDQGQRARAIVSGDG